MNDRPCMRCHLPFKKQFDGQRICADCNKDNEKKSGKLSLRAAKGKRLQRKITAEDNDLA